MAKQTPNQMEIWYALCSKQKTVFRLDLSSFPFLLVFQGGWKSWSLIFLSFSFSCSISYSSIHIATHSGRCLFLTYIEGNGEAVALGFKCESNLAANAIYRAVTEKHAFYSCETVRNAITSQFIRDLKGTIVSLFNENSALGKNYVFDIRRTCREVYDHTRRALYQLESQPNADELLLENQSNTFEPDDGTPKMVRSYESQDTGSRQLHMNDESMAGPCSRACCKVCFL